MLYIDGALESTVIASPFTPAPSIAPFLVGGITLGSSTNPTGAFNGLIDDVRIYDNALSAADVEALFNPVSAVPEPSTFALASVAIVLVSLVIGRRRNQVL
jgi:hypothetical protein